MELGYSHPCKKCSKILDPDLIWPFYLQAICYGYQLVAKYFGGKVEKKKMREDGQFAIEVRSKTDLYECQQK